MRKRFSSLSSSISSFFFGFYINLSINLSISFFISLFLLLSSGCGEAAGPVDLTLGGHLKSLNFVQKRPQETACRGFTDTQVRFDVSATFSKSIKMAYSQVADLLVGEGARTASREGPFDLVNLDAEPVGEKDTVINLYPDRLNLSWESGKFSAVIGRQAIGFGNLLGFSPLDLVAPFRPLALDTDIRPGVDALKLEYYPEAFSTISGVAVVSRESQNRSYLLLYTLAGGKGDFNLLLGDNRKKPALGLGYTQDLLGIGVRTESLFFGAERDGNNSGYAEAGLEVDYLFQNDLHVDFEFFYNGDGAGNPENYKTENYKNERPLFLGRYYAIISLDYDLTPLLKFSPAAIVNLRDRSTLVSPRFTYSISDNSEVLVFIDFALGRSPDGIIRRSEYGSAAHGGGLFLRLFF